MARKDYIDKITQNLEHLTKDELKDVATLTNAQLGVRLKVAEKEYWGKEIANLKSQLQQQSLPVVPECVGGAIEKDKQANISISDVFEATFSYKNHHLTEAGLWTKNNPEKYIIARNIGYTVEKPQLFYLKNTLTHEYLYRKYKTSLGEQSYCKGTDGKPLDYCLFTLDEIESMNTGSYEQIEVAE